MNRNLIVILAMLLLSISSCQGKIEKAKAQMIEKRTSEMKIEKAIADSVDNQFNKDRKTTVIENKTLDNQVKSNTSQANPGDSIICVWEVKNDYYMAIYEIVKYENQYFGKIHYYNDGKEEYEGNNNKEDYFLEGVTYQDGKYTIGKMFMPDGTNHQVKFTLKGDELTAQMTIQGQLYKEVWKRKKIE